MTDEKQENVSKVSPEKEAKASPELNSQDENNEYIPDPEEDIDQGEPLDVSSSDLNGNILVEVLEKKNNDLNEKLLRTMADMENLRRRKDREIVDKEKYAVTKFAKEILSVADNIQRTIEAVPEEALSEDEHLKTLIDGVHMTEREILNIFERHGITRIDPNGEAFDPNLHQAMFEVPSPDVPAGTVVQVMQAGYVIGERTLRPALVGVSKGGVKEAKLEEPPELPNKDEKNDEKNVDPKPETEEKKVDKDEPVEAKPKTVEKTEKPSDAANNDVSQQDDPVGQKVDKSA